MGLKSIVSIVTYFQFQNEYVNILLHNVFSIGIVYLKSI